ncbi:unnamed protein product [Cochlearia groenlandica]
MEIDAKDICVTLYKIIRFTKNTTFKYVKRYPLASCVSAITIVLYIFLPWLFYLILCSSPLIASALFYLRLHHYKSETTTDRGLTSISRDGFVTEKAELKHQRSVRRNARRKVEEVGKDWDSSQASEDERGKVIMTTLYGETTTQDLERFKRDRTLLVSEETLVVESNLEGEDDYVVVDDVETEIDCSSSSSSSSSSEEEEEEEEEKERCEDVSKVVIAWTEDDQKNLMDLGTSEIERNKRLENLITRRRSRRLFLLAAERSLMDMEVPRICIGRNYYGLDKENYEIDGLVMPGSAPSVLLPRRNPFDLPYDPLEEKPNLTGDSFQQEFAESNPKDAFFCRHESFHHRIFPSESQNDPKLSSLWRKTVDGRPKPLQGSSDQQQPLLKESDLTRGKEDDMEAGEVRIETDSIRNDDSYSNTTLSPREREKDFNVSDQSDASETIRKRNEHVGNPLIVPRSSGSSSLATARQRYMEIFGYRTRKTHMVSHSVDSDLQVEVSELGSPPTSADENDSSDEERSLFIYESEIGKDGEESKMLPVDKDDLNETDSLASPEIEEAVKFEPMVSQPDIAFSEKAEELKKLPENSADEIKISYDSDEPVPSERTDQESEEPCETSHEAEIQQLAEAEASDVNQHGNSEESATSPRSVLPATLPRDQTQSEDLDHTSDGQLRNVELPAESSHSRLDEHSDATETIQEKQEGSEETLVHESIDPTAEEVEKNRIN